MNKCNQLYYNAIIKFYKPKRRYAPVRLECCMLTVCEPNKLSANHTDAVTPQMMHIC